MKIFKLTKSELTWLKRNLHNFTTKEQFDHIIANRTEDKKISYTKFRNTLYHNKLKKCKILRWSKKETAFLLENYQSLGNIQIAKELSTKKRSFTKKNVEKKMMLLGLKRTKSQLSVIIQNHKKKGVYAKGHKKMWQTRGVAKVGDRRTWVLNGTPKVVIKTKEGFVQYARWRYLQLHGSIKPGNKVYLKDGNPLNVEDENLTEAPAGSCLMKAYREYIKMFNKNRKLETNTNEQKSSKTPVNLPKQRVIKIRLDRKTVVYLKPGTNIDEFKKTYHNIPII